VKTALRSCRMDRTAAIKKVLSPISVARIMATPDVNPFQKDPCANDAKNE
jgi:hypothetical protein